MVVKIMVPFGCPKYQVPYSNRGPTRDHNFDNHPHDTPDSRNAQEAHLVCGIPAVGTHALHDFFGGIPIFHWYTQVLHFAVLTVFLSVAAAV